MDRAQWTAALREQVRASNAQRGVPRADELDLLARAQHDIEGGFLQSWLGGIGPRMLRERSALLELSGRVEREPLIVLHGDVAMLVACRTLLGDEALQGEGRVVALEREAYQAFMERHGGAESPEFRWHVSSWSWFDEADAAILERARTLGHTIDDSRRHFTHVTGTLWGERCGLGVEHLWTFDGRELGLVEEAITHYRY